MFVYFFQYTLLNSFMYGPQIYYVLLLNTVQVYNATFTLVMGKILFIAFMAVKRKRLLW